MLTLAEFRDCQFGWSASSGARFIKQTKIGDEIAFGVSVAAAVSAQAGGSASASARSAISLRFGPCDDDSGGSPPGPPAPVPTLSEWSLIVLVMLLAAIGYRRVRKQQG